MAKRVEVIKVRGRIENAAYHRQWVTVGRKAFPTQLIAR